MRIDSFSPFARSSLLHLQEVGELTALKPHTSSRSNLQSFLFFIVLDGEGQLKYEGKTYELRAGSSVFIDCNLPHSHTTSNPLWTIQWIHFNGPAMSSVYSKYCDRGGRPAFNPVPNTFTSMKEVGKTQPFIES